MSELIKQLDLFVKRYAEIEGLRDTDTDAWGTQGTNFDFNCRAWLMDNADALKELIADAEKMWVTMDGKRITPGMELFYIYTLNEQAWVNPRTSVTDPRCCYSTRAAAEAALAKDRAALAALNSANAKGGR